MAVAGDEDAVVLLLPAVAEADALAAAEHVAQQGAAGAQLDALAQMQLRHRRHVGLSEQVLCAGAARARSVRARVQRSGW